MAQRKANYPITPQMHALMHAQRVSALKAERAAKFDRLAREFKRDQDERLLRVYGVARDDPRWPLVQRAVSKAVVDGMDFRNTRAVRKVADKVLADLAEKEHREETNVVYYVGHAGLVKIGTTKNLSSRLRAYPPDAELLATETGSYRRERERHDQFAASLAHRREWFHPTPDLLAHIDGLRVAV